MKREMIRDFTEGKILPMLVSFATPLFLANLLQIAYNMVDMIVVGQAIGQVGLSAVTIGGEVTDLFTVLIMGFSNAAQIIISQHIGAGKRDLLGKIIGTFASVMLILALICTALALSLRHVALDLMSTPAEAYQEALNYSIMSMSGIVFVFGYNAVSSVMRGLGDSKHPFIFIAVAAVTNIGLDVAFVVGLGMGAFGAALATVMSQAISFISALIFLTKNKDRLGFKVNKSDFKPDKTLTGTLFKLGIPMALRSAAITITKMFTNSFINSYGVTVSAVTGIGNKFNQIGNLIQTCTTTAGASMIGQNIGAEKYDRVPKIMGYVWAISFGLVSIIVTIILITPTGVFGLFTSDGSIMTVAMEFVPVVILLLYACAVRSGGNSLINGSGNYIVNLLVAIIDAIILRVGLSLLFGLVFGWGYKGFWYGNAIASYTPLFIAIIFFFSGKWKTRKGIVKD